MYSQRGIITSVVSAENVEWIMDAKTASETLIIFTTSPTGLGHLRVMDALMDGLLPGSEYARLGIVKIRANKIHALGSRIPILTKFTEFYQTNPLAERIVTSLITSRYRRETKDVEARLREIREKYSEKERFIIVSTHFALAYPIVEIKERLAREMGVQIINAVIVTDDSPQRPWAVEGSDFIFTPSHETTDGLKKYLKPGSRTKIETVSFPVSPRLNQKLTKKDKLHHHSQLDPAQKEALHISIPISGAAVQLEFIEPLVKILAQENFRFTIVGQLTRFTEDFFKKMRQVARAQLAIGGSAKQTVNMYESIFYQGLRPSVEITKPSEQTFKAILQPDERGGVILLLTWPVGRQEYDNLDFLIRHLLLPNDEEQAKLEKYLLVGNSIPNDERPMWHYKASHWRAIRLPKDPQKAAIFIKKLKEEGLLHSMLSYVAENQIDLTSDGVSQVWKKISKVLTTQLPEKSNS